MKCPEAVAIAKDVLNRIELNKLNIESGKYIFQKAGFPIKGSLQEQIDMAEANCEVCLLGGIFMSYTRLYNKVLVEELCNDILVVNRLTKKLRQYFSIKELQLMEFFFEGTCFIGDSGNFSGSHNMGSKNYEIYSEEYDNLSFRDRMVRVCMNIIDNGGEFIP